jgi:CheY-like chemotaxis protein
LDAEVPGPRWGRQLGRIGKQSRLEEAATVTRRLAHDFANVLTGILGFTELALGRLDVRTPARTYLEEVLQVAQQATSWTTELRWFTRRQVSPPPACTLGPIVADEAKQVRALPNRAAELRVDLPPQLPEVAAEPEALHLLIRHLLNNAWEAVESHGTVTVAGRTVQLSDADGLDLLGNVSAGPYVEISVTDDGCGLSDETRRRLFVEMFFTTKARHRGLGLAVVYGILYAHHGGLLLKSEPGKGTCVRVFLPVANLSAPAPEGGQRSEASVPGEKVLVVDDDPAILQFCASTLHAAGYRVQTASSGREALDSFAAAQEPFRLVLADVVMPRMSGMDLARRLRGNFANVNVLFMSGQAPGETVQAPGAHAPIELLPKPFRPERLLSAVRQALDRPHWQEPFAAGGPG